MSDHYTPMPILRYVLDRLRPNSPDEPPRRCKSAETPDDDPRPTAEGQSIPSSVDPDAPSVAVHLHYHADDMDDVEIERLLRGDIP